jgi:hypothetical protein
LKLPVRDDIAAKRWELRRFALSFCPIMTNEIVNIAQKRNRGGSQAKRRQQAEQMLMLRNRGWTVHAIAQEMGVSEGTVKNRIKEALDRREFPHTDEYRNRQNDHLDDWCAGTSRALPGWKRSSLAQSQREIRSSKPFANVGIASKRCYVSLTGAPACW